MYLQYIFAHRNSFMKVASHFSEASGGTWCVIPMHIKRINDYIIKDAPSSSQSLLSVSGPDAQLLRQS